MKQTIPFEKDITFKTDIDEITAISLDNDLKFIKEDYISGNFYISGEYKMLKASTTAEPYNFKVPCEIAISDDYDTKDAIIDIDDFYYEINNNVLKVNIVVTIDNLIKKEYEDEDVEEYEDLDEQFLAVKEDISIADDRDSNIIYTATESVKETKENFLTYKVYVFKENDTLSEIKEKYNVTDDDLESYNDVESIKVGSKIVIPSNNA